MSVFTLHGIHNDQSSALEGEFFRQHGYTQAPVVLQCHLTLRCELSCAHCLAVHAGVCASDMPLDLFETLCRDSAALGVEEILLTGGEPLLRDDFGDIVDCLRRHCLSWSLNTATCPDQIQQAALLRHPPGYVAVSLDGPVEVHNAFRGSPGAFANAMASIRFFSSLRRTTVCVGTTITTHNLPYFEETAKLVRESGAHRWGIHLLLPEGRAKSRQDLFPSTRQLRALIENIARQRRDFPVSLCDELGYAGEWEPLVRDAGFFCAAGRAMCAVLPDGSVMPCSTLDPRHSQGNLNQNALADVWRTGFAAQRQFQPKGKCARCPDQTVCGSGCWLQRVHGTQCFHQLWKIPESFKAAAGIALCLGGLGGTAAHGQTSTEGMTIADGSVPGASNDATPAPLIIGKGIYASKASGGRRLPDRAKRHALARPALLWLQQQQNADGTWGNSPHRSTLTALAVMAFFSQGETVHSDIFEKTITEGLRVVLNQVKDSPPDQRFDSREKVLSVWCLAETYSMTRIPSLRQALPDDPNRLLVDNATPWHLLAWEAVNRALELKPQQSIDDLVARLASDTDPLVRDAIRYAVQNRMTGQTYGRSFFYANMRENRRETKDPFLFALLNSLALANEPEEYASLYWYHYYIPVIEKAHSAVDSVGWWDAPSLGIAQTRETEGMSEEDARIYTTALVVLSLQTVFFRQG